jgi:hypothetical protein
MMPMRWAVPPNQSEAIVAAVQRSGGFDGADQVDEMVVSVGPNLELTLSMEAADRLADAIIDAFAVYDDKCPVLFPAAVKGW